MRVLVETLVALGVVSLSSATAYAGWVALHPAVGVVAGIAVMLGYGLVQSKRLAR